MSGRVRTIIAVATILATILFAFWHNQPEVAETPFEPKLIEDPDSLSLSSKSFQSTYLNEMGLEVLLSNNSDTRLPIASISKILTAVVVNQYYDPALSVSFTQEDFFGKGSGGRYRVGDTFSAEELLHSLLIESDNDAARALVRSVGEKHFVSLMNEKALHLGMRDTYFVNPTGLDPNFGGANLSTTEDITLLIKEVIEKYPEILKITRSPQKVIFNLDGEEHHVATSTNELLFEEDWQPVILGGKTGETPLSGRNLVLATKAPNDRGILISVVLNSEDHFSDMKELLEWVSKNYIW